MNKYIYYTGIGAKENGKHTTKEFMKIMEKHPEHCSRYLTEIEYEPCIKTTNMTNDFWKKYNKNNKYKRSKKLEAKFRRTNKKCIKRKMTFKNRKCNFKEYLEYSGAEIK
jgi:hypothetical protein